MSFRGELNKARMKVLRFLHRGRLVKVRLRDVGFSMYVDTSDDGISKDLLLHGRREPIATRLFRSYLKPGQTVIDIGANIGYYVLMEARALSPSGRVYAIEPGPKNVGILKNNVLLNQCEHIVNIDLAAVSDTTGAATLHLANRCNLHTLSRVPLMETYVKFKGTVEVPCYTLDDYLKSKGVDPQSVDIIRMDIEGHEDKALDGMSRTLRAANDLLLFIEVHPKLMRAAGGDAAFDAFLDKLEGHGLQLLECALSLSSRRDELATVRDLRELARFHEAVEVFLWRSA